MTKRILHSSGIATAGWIIVHVILIYTCSVDLAESLSILVDFFSLIRMLIRASSSHVQVVDQSFAISNSVFQSLHDECTLTSIRNTRTPILDFNYSLAWIQFPLDRTFTDCLNEEIFKITVILSAQSRMQVAIRDVWTLFGQADNRLTNIVVHF